MIASSEPVLYAEKRSTRLKNADSEDNARLRQTHHLVWRRFGGKMTELDELRDSYHRRKPHRDSRDGDY